MESAPASIEPPPKKRVRGLSPWRRRIGVIAARIIVWVVIGWFGWICFLKGLEVRRLTWDLTAPIHFTMDIRRGCYWGLECSGPEGYLNQYEKMAVEQPEWDQWLDYAPLRLLVMDRWGTWIRKNMPPNPDGNLEFAWNSSYEYNAPVLRFNAAMDLLAAVIAFFLTRLWVVRAGANLPHWHFRGVWQGMAAALILWFNPAVLLSAHGWPTWDQWIIPMYLLAALLASLDWWFCAGAAIAIGAMFKGQQLLMVPVFILWPLVQGRVGAALRWCSGMIFAFALIASPWLVTYIPADALRAARTQELSLDWPYPPNLFAMARVVDRPALAWIGEIVLTAAAVPFLLRVVRRRAGQPSGSRLGAILRSRWPWLILAAAVIVCQVIWPFLLRRNRQNWEWGLWAGLVLAAAVLLLRRGYQGYVLAGALGAALLCCMTLFNGSHAWWDCAFHYGTIHWPFMIMGLTDNLPGILADRYGWSHDVTDIALTLPAMIGHHWPVMFVRNGWWPAFDADMTSKQLFNGIFMVLLPISGIAVGLQAKRWDRRVLVALVTPWLLFFCFPVQIHERYLLFAAGAAAICVGQSVGMALLGLFLTGATVVMTLHVMLAHSNRSDWGAVLAQHFPALCTPNAGDTIFKYIDGSHPDLGWGILVACAVFFYLSVTPGQGARRLFSRKIKLRPRPAIAEEQLKVDMAREYAGDKNGAGGV